MTTKKRITLGDLERNPQLIKKISTKKRREMAKTIHDLMNNVNLHLSSMLKDILKGSGEIKLPPRDFEFLKESLSLIGPLIEKIERLYGEKKSIQKEISILKAKERAVNRELLKLGVPPKDEKGEIPVDYETLRELDFPAIVEYQNLRANRKPGRKITEFQKAVIELHKKNSSWSARKIAHDLIRQYAVWFRKYSDLEKVSRVTTRVYQTLKRHPK